MSEIPTNFQLNSKEVFQALGMNISGISEYNQELIATFLAQSAHSIKNALIHHESESNIDSKLADLFSLTSEQASKISAPFHLILQDDEGDVNSLIDPNKQQGKNQQQQQKKQKKKDNKMESDESSSESDSSSNSSSSSSSDEKRSSYSESDEYISMAQKQVPISGRIRKSQGKFMKIPFNLKGVTGVTQVGNLITVGIIGTSAIGVADSSLSDNSSYLGFSRQGMHYASGGSFFSCGKGATGNKSIQINDIIGFEIDMISHRIYFFHTFQQQPACIINTPASLKITYGNALNTQYKVVAIYKLKKPLADPKKSPTVKTWSS
ncbi:MAG: hypothetical protein EZS28_005562 [Streblomastix strix]|uniref:B30.2/SPRY domain-containing protein n=1 Tax=Streblomastix strix TaxID=222440 RepID=A0A5J4WX46_9EUKA|nr:MAG: hypothetical protein EZS28_005562 [Streblomastix strix]